MPVIFANTVFVKVPTLFASRKLFLFTVNNVLSGIYAYGFRELVWLKRT